MKMEIIQKFIEWATAVISYLAIVAIGITNMIIDIVKNLM